MFHPWAGKTPLPRPNPLLYSCLGDPVDRGTWLATVHGVARVGVDLATSPPPPRASLVIMHSRFEL